MYCNYFLIFVIPNFLQFSLRLNETALSWGMCDGLIIKKCKVFCKHGREKGVLKLRERK